jgi:hypothetical protein
VTDGGDRDKEKEDLPPGGEAMQRRRAFLQKRGLPLDEEPEDEPTSEEEEQPPKEEADPSEPAKDGTPDKDDR